MHKSSIIGRLTGDPQSKTIGEATLVTFCLAVNVKEGGERKAHFFDFEAWRQSGEYIEKYAKKGDAVYLEADVRTDHFEDKQGNKRTKTKFIVKPMSFQFLPAGSNPDGISSEGTDQVPKAPLPMAKAKVSDTVADPELSEEVPW